MLFRKSISLEVIQSSAAGNVWDFGNQILYDMCKRAPEHNNKGVILGKLWLIGRAYAAAIERRKNADTLNVGDDFDLNVVAPKMLEIGKELDQRILSLNKHALIEKPLLKEIIDTHRFLMDAFSQISGLNKRSLASKYLHFHAPQMFYIYDSQAIRFAREYVWPDKRLRAELNRYGDKEYVELVIRLFTFQQYVVEQHGLVLSPRAIDSIHLGY